MHVSLSVERRDNRLLICSIFQNRINTEDLGDCAGLLYGVLDRFEAKWIGSSEAQTNRREGLCAGPHRCWLTTLRNEQMQVWEVTDNPVIGQRPIGAAEQMVRQVMER